MATQVQLIDLTLSPAPAPVQNVQAAQVQQEIQIINGPPPPVIPPPPAGHLQAPIVVAPGQNDILEILVGDYILANFRVSKTTGCLCADIREGFLRLSPLAQTPIHPTEFGTYVQRLRRGGFRLSHPRSWDRVTTEFGEERVRRYYYFGLKPRSWMKPHITTKSFSFTY